MRSKPIFPAALGTPFSPGRRAMNAIYRFEAPDGTQVTELDVYRAKHFPKTLCFEKGRVLSSILRNNRGISSFLISKTGTSLPWIDLQEKIKTRVVLQIASACLQQAVCVIVSHKGGRCPGLPQIPSVYRGFGPVLC